MIDNYVYGTVDRLSPEAPVPILEANDEKFSLGGAGNVVTTLKNLGAQVDFVSVIGDDKNNKIALDLAKSLEISAEFLLIEKTRKTTVKKRFVATSPYFQMLLRVDSETHSQILKETEEKIASKMENLIPKCDIIVISDYNKGLMNSSLISLIINLAKKSNKKIIVDTKKSLYDYKGVYLAVPNYKELCIAFGMKPTNDDSLIEQNTLKLSKMLHSNVIVKRSEKGATIIDEKGLRTQKSKAEKIINVSGAGDIFVAITALCIVSSFSLDKAVELANIGCAKAIAKRTPTISLDELREYL